jgi:uncharacterized glyoxalase superfamily protein PhnB
MQLNHYLNFDGQTEAAFNFYKSVFGGEFATFMRYGDLPSDESSFALSEADQQKIMHVSLPINASTILMASDTNDQFCAQSNTVFIDFAGFNDGRGYSFAALLRRQGFQGELRATGDVFNTFVIKEGKDILEAAAGLNDFRNPYQASTAVAQASYQTGA